MPRELPTKEVGAKAMECCPSYFQLFSAILPSHTHTHTHTHERTHTHTRTHTGEESEGERKGVEVENIKMS